MRVSIFCHNYPPHVGGLEVVVRELARRLAQRHQVVVVTSAADGCVGRREEDGLVVWRLPVARLLDRVGVPYPMPTGRAVRAALAEAGRADVLHAHGCLYPSSVMAAALSRQRGIPMVVTEHVGEVPYTSSVLQSLQRGAWMMVAPLVAGRASELLALNARIRDLLVARFPLLPVGLTRNGVDTDVFLPSGPDARIARRRQFGLPDDAPVVLVVARNSEKKNVQSVLAIPRRGISLLICGAERNLQGEALTDLGVVPHERMPDVFGAADVLMHAGEGEGFPVAVQEAMACGVPILLRRDDGYGDLLPSHAVQSFDAGQEAQALQRILHDSALRQQLGAAGRQHAVQHWSWGAVVAAHENTYLRMTERPRA